METWIDGVKECMDQSLESKPSFSLMTSTCPRKRSTEPSPQLNSFANGWITAVGTSSMEKRISVTLFPSFSVLPCNPRVAKRLLQIDTFDTITSYMLSPTRMPHLRQFSATLWTGCFWARPRTCMELALEPARITSSLPRSRPTRSFSSGSARPPQSLTILTTYVMSQRCSRVLLNQILVLFLKMPV